MLKVVVVAGDVAWHESLTQAARSTDRTANRVPGLTSTQWRGGAWWLADLIGGLKLDVELHSPPDDSPAGRSIATWKKVKADQNAKESEPKVWRVDRMLGVVPPAKGVPNLPAESATADVLVLDDLDLGFAGVNWAKVLPSNATVKSIIFRASTPFGETSLWKHLIGNFSDRLTVVVPVSALRDRGAKISTPLSWDKAIEEIAREFEDGISSRDLGLAKATIVPFACDGAAYFKGKNLERCLYDPEHLEGEWERGGEGSSLSSASILSAALVKHELMPEASPMFLTLARGLNAIRQAHAIGGGTGAVPEAKPGIEEIAAVLRGERKPEHQYYTAFPHEILNDPIMLKQPATESNLLRDLTGAGHASALTKAIEVVLMGPEKALAPAPSLQLGDYFTVDREEIERLNAVRNLIHAYLDKPHDRKPVSIAVFGPPGSGKSFAVKQIAKQFSSDKPDNILEFNLSQFAEGDLDKAFHQVRDAAVKGQVPFVFWDEFDCDNLNWLKAFLAPMNDATFVSAGTPYRLGRAIFVFAGGTRDTFERFATQGAFREVKGPDFVSRLRGYINIKGPNRARGEDFTHTIRRALLLRSAIKEHAPHLLDGATKRISISPTLAWALLSATKYTHGARSLNSVVGMSSLVGTHHFGPAHLPPRDLLRMHVSSDFFQLGDWAQLGAGEIDHLAAESHKAYREYRVSQGRIDATLNKSFEDLTEEDKDINRSGVRFALTKFAEFGYRLVLDHGVRLGAAPAPLEPDTEEMMKAEHDRWLRERLLKGWARGDETNRDVLINKYIVKYAKLPVDHKDLEPIPAKVVKEKLGDLGFALER